MTRKAHPEDLLVVHFDWERHGWPEFGPSQIVNINDAHHLYGRCPRRAWITHYAEMNMGERAWDHLHVMQARGTVVDRAMHWRPEPEPRSLLSRLVDRLIFGRGPV